MRRLLCLLLCVAILLGVASTLVGAVETDANAPTAMSATLTQAKNGARGVLTMTFDDGDYNFSTMLWLNDMFERYDLRGSCMMSVGNIFGQTYDTTTARYRQWKELFAKGYLEPESHGMTHKGFPLSANEEKGSISPKNNTPQMYQTEIVDSRDLLRQYFPEYHVLNMASAYNILSTCSYQVDDYGNLELDERGQAIRIEDGGAQYVAERTYYAIRQGNRGLQSLDPAPTTQTPAQAGGWHHLRMYFLVNGVSEETAHSWIDGAIEEQKWLITLTHDVGYAASDDIVPEKAEAFFAYAAEKVREGTLWCATFDEATRYIRERQNSTVNATLQNGKVTVTITMAEKTADGFDLPADIFCLPLTAKVEVPAEWDAVSYVLDGKTQYARAFAEGGRNYVLVNAIPNGGSIELTQKYIENTVVTPTVAATLRSDGEPTTDPLTVSVRSGAYVPGYSARVYAKISVADVADGARVYLPFKVEEDVMANIHVYGVANVVAATGWRPDTLTMENAPAIDYDGVGVEPSAVFKGEPIATIGVVGAGVYGVEVTDYANAIKAANGSIATLIFVLDSHKDLTVPISFNVGDLHSDDVLTYTYYQNFERSNGGYVNRGCVGSDQVVSNQDNHTDEGESSFSMRVSASYQCVFLPNIINEKNVLEQGDLGNRYVAKVWTKAMTTGTFSIGVSDGRADIRDPAGEQNNVYTVSADEVGKWIERTYAFEVTQSMIDNVRTYLLIKPYGFSASTSNVVYFFVDDISVMGYQSSIEKTICRGLQYKAVGGTTTDLALSVSPDLPLAGVRKTYVSLDIPEGTLGAKLRFTLRGEGGTVYVNGLEDALPDPPVYANAPASAKDETMDMKAVTQGMPLGVYEANAEVELDVDSLIRYGICALAFSTEDASEVTIENVRFLINRATNDPTYDVTLDGATIALGVFEVTIPEDVAICFDASGKLYRAGDAVTLTEDLDLTTPKIELLEGARVRLIDAPALAFEAVVDDATLALLEAANARFEVKMVVKPGAIEAIGADDVRIDATLTDGVYRGVFEVAADKKAENYAAMAVLQITIGEETYEICAKHTAEAHTRSLQTVANAAYNDRASEKSDAYGYETAEGNFSPYGEKELKVLRAMLGE